MLSLLAMAWLGLELSVAIVVQTFGTRLWQLGLRRPGDGPQLIGREVLQGFYRTSSDPDLGWDHQPRRLVRSYETTLVSAYGDSFTECTSTDEETWQTYLSDLLRSNVVNYGVYAYGPDQALLKLKRVYPSQPTPVVLFGYSSVDLSRIVNVYGQARMIEETGTFAFDGHPFFLPTKPRYLLEEGRLELLPNPVRTEQDFLRLVFDPGFAASFSRHDRFRAGYDLERYCVALRFPYVASLSRALYRRATSRIPHAQDFTPGLLADGETFPLLAAIFDEFQRFARERSFRGIVVLFGDQRELRYYLRTGTHQHLREVVTYLETRGFPYIDTVEILASHHRARKDGAPVSAYYEASGHHSAEAHRVIAGGIAAALSVPATGGG